MLAKRTSRNRVTLPRTVVDATGPAEYYEVSTEHGSIVLTPLRLHSANAVRARLAALGITECDVKEAVAWARKRGG